MRGLITAIRTLTVLRLPGKDAEKLSSSLYYFPFVGAIIGIMVGGAVYAIARFTGWNEMAAAAGVFLSIRLTGCLHIDGLADVSDSFGAHTREKRLEIMKDSRSGVYGVTAVVLSILFKYVCLLKFAGGGSAVIILPAVMALSRSAQVAVITGMPYARKEGTAGAFVSGASLRHFAAVAVMCAVFVSVLLDGPAVALIAAAYAVSMAIKVWARKEYGGITGDLIGFTNEVVEVLCLAIAGVLLR